MLRRLLLCLTLVGLVSLLTAAAAFAAPAFAPVGSSPFATGDNPLSVAFSSDGSLLAVANSNSGNVSVYSVGSAGGLTPVPGSPFTTGAGSQAVAFDPAAPFFFVANTGGTSVSAFAYSGTTVFALGSTTTTSHPESLSLNRAGNILAVGQSDSTAEMFFVSVSGGLTSAGTPTTLAMSTPYSVALSPDGSMLAAADGAADEVNVYGVNQAGGIVGLLAGGTLHTGTSSTPNSVAFSRNGSLLAVADKVADAVSVYTVSSEVFTAAPGSPFATGGSPTKVAFSPGSDLVAAGNTNGTASVFSAAATGVLTPVAGSPFTVDVTSPVSGVAFGRAGGLLAGLDENNAAVSVFSVGAPTAAIASPAGGAYYAVGQKVATSFGCTDAAAAPGISSCADSNGATAGAGGLVTSSVGAHSYRVTATSADGQSSSTAIPYTVASAPTVSITTPADGVSYAVGQKVKAGYACTEGTDGPGIASCSGSTANAASIKTTSAGTHSFTVTAKSRDGQQTTKRVRYTVAPAAQRSGSAAVLTLNFSTPVVVLANSWQFGQVSSGISVGTGQSARGDRTGSLTLKISPKLNKVSAIRKAVGDSTLPTASFVLTTEYLGESETRTYTLTEPEIISYQMSGQGSGPSEQVTIAYAGATSKVTSTQKTPIARWRPFGNPRPVSFSGTIVQLEPSTASFVLAESSGRLVVIHSSASGLKVGRQATVSATVLIDGTYQAKKVSFAAAVHSALLQGTVTFTSKKGHYYVISVSGAAIGLYHLGKRVQPPALQQTVTVHVAITRKGTLVQRSVGRRGQDHGASCVQGLFAGLTTLSGNAESSFGVEVEVLETRQDVSGTLMFPITQKQWGKMEPLLKVGSSTPPTLTLCGLGESQSSTGGQSLATWKTLVKAWIDGKHPRSLL